MALNNDKLVFTVRQECDCCERHQIDKPKNLKLLFKSKHSPNGPENQCGCNCRN